MQNPKSQSQEFEELKVPKDSDCVQMYEFVKSSNKDRTFENGKAFYEFTRDKEDLNSYRDIVLKDKVSDNACLASSSEDSCIMLYLRNLQLMLPLCVNQGLSCFMGSLEHPVWT